MEQPPPLPTMPGLRRRSLVKGVAWMVPVVTFASAAPAYAASGTGSSCGLTVLAWGSSCIDPSESPQATPDTYIFWVRFDSAAGIIQTELLGATFAGQSLTLQSIVNQDLGPVDNPFYVVSGGGTYWLRLIFSGPTGLTGGFLRIHYRCRAGGSTGAWFPGSFDYTVPGLTTVDNPAACTWN